MLWALVIWRLVTEWNKDKICKAFLTGYWFGLGFNNAMCISTCRTLASPAALGHLQGCFGHLGCCGIKASTRPGDQSREDQHSHLSRHQRTKAWPPPERTGITVSDAHRTEIGQNLCDRCTCCDFLADTGKGWKVRFMGNI